MGSSYIQISNGSINDTAGNPVIATTNATGYPIAIPAADYMADLIPPMLTNFTFDLNSGFIQLTFSDVVDPSTFTATEITMLEVGDITLSQPSNRFTFTRGTSPSPNGFIVNFTMYPEDLNAIKMLPSVFIDPCLYYRCYSY